MNTTLSVSKLLLKFTNHDKQQEFSFKHLLTERFPVPSQTQKIASETCSFM